MVWRPCTVKGFKVSSFYRALCRGCDSSFPWKVVWKVKAPPWVWFFMSIVKGKNLKNDYLRRQGIVIPDWCSLCKSDGVSIDHLFITYLYILGRLITFCGIFWGKMGDGSKGEKLSVLLKVLSAPKRKRLLEPRCKTQAHAWLMWSAFFL